MTSTVYSDEFLEALGAWQRGWSEDPDRRAQLAEALIMHVAHLPMSVCAVSSPCFRKRFLYHGDCERIFLGGLDEGPTSWTIHRAYAKEFKGHHRREAERAAVFVRTPEPEEVVLNIVSLWADPTFRSAMSSFESRGGPNADALANFKASQGEVILTSKLVAIDIVGLTGVSSAIDDLFDSLGILDAARALLMRDLVSAGVYPGEPTWVWDEAAISVVDRTYDRLIEKLEQLTRTALSRR
ncbi:MAG: hypothetical protein CGW95_10535 [Phenylobacterium zucineum]|nr:MAG: hypothetical protein CGW95_10535 [Phenylobacterium zucineum]